MGYVPPGAILILDLSELHIIPLANTHIPSEDIYETSASVQLNLTPGEYVLIISEYVGGVGGTRVGVDGTLVAVGAACTNVPQLEINRLITRKQKNVV